MEKKTTEKLLNILKRTDTEKSLRKFVSEFSAAEIEPQDFHLYFMSLPEMENRSAADIIRAAGIERTYGYQILNGTRKPGRDRVVMLALAAGISLSELQHCLAIVQEAALYARNRRDAVLIFAIERKLSVEETNELLEHFEEPLLISGIKEK